MGSELVCCLCGDPATTETDGLVACKDCKPTIETILSPDSTALTASNWAHVAGSLGVHSKFLQTVLQKMVLQDPGLAAFTVDLVGETWPNARPVTPTATRKKVLQMIGEAAEQLKPDAVLPIKIVKQIAAECGVAEAFVKKHDRKRKEN